MLVLQLNMVSAAELTSYEFMGDVWERARSVQMNKHTTLQKKARLILFSQLRHRGKNHKYVIYLFLETRPPPKARTSKKRSHQKFCRRKSKNSSLVLQSTDLCSAKHPTQLPMPTRQETRSQHIRQQTSASYHGSTTPSTVQPETPRATHAKNGIHTRGKERPTTDDPQDSSHKLL